MQDIWKPKKKIFFVHFKVFFIFAESFSKKNEYVSLFFKVFLVLFFTIIIKFKNKKKITNDKQSASFRFDELKVNFSVCFF